MRYIIAERISVYGMWHYQKHKHVTMREREMKMTFCGTDPSCILKVWRCLRCPTLPYILGSESYYQFVPIWTMVTPE